MNRYFAIPLIITGASVAAQSATLDLIPSYVGYYTDSTFSTFVATATPVSGAGRVHQVDVSLRLNDAAAGEDFNFAIFNIDLGAGLSAFDFGSGKWNASSGTYDSNGTAPQGSKSHWEYGNADFGEDANDLQVIVTEIPATEAANRQYGEQPRPAAGFADQLGFPTLLGSVFLEWDGSLTDMGISPISGSSWGIYTANSTGVGEETPLTAGFNGGTLTLVPEPVSLGLLAVGAVGLLGRRRRAL